MGVYPYSSPRFTSLRFASLWNSFKTIQHNTCSRFNSQLEEKATLLTCTLIEVFRFTHPAHRYGLFRRGGERHDAAPTSDFLE